MKITIEAKSGEGSMSLARKIQNTNGLEIFNVHQEKNNMVNII